jgi:ribonuclease HII
VVAAVVILPIDRFNLLAVLGEVRDSKRMTASLRQAAYHKIRQVAQETAVGKASAQEVDEKGIINATRLAMLRAIKELASPPDHLLIDHIELPEIKLPQTAISKGDSTVLSIAAASVIAKVTRDEIMTRYANAHPGYGFQRHKGYGTFLHRTALSQLGVCPIHRTSFAPIAAQATESN